MPKARQKISAFCPEGDSPLSDFLGALLGDGDEGEDGSVVLAAIAGVFPALDTAVVNVIGVDGCVAVDSERLPGVADVKETEVDIVVTPEDISAEVDAKEIDVGIVVDPKGPSVVAGVKEAGVDVNSDAFLIAKASVYASFSKPASSSVIPIM